MVITTIRDDAAMPHREQIASTKKESERDMDSRFDSLGYICSIVLINGFASD